jgi:hypothetical protein
MLTILVYEILNLSTYFGLTQQRMAGEKPARRKGQARAKAHIRLVRPRLADCGKPSPPESRELSSSHPINGRRPPAAAGFLSSRPSRRRRSPPVKTPEHGSSTPRQQRRGDPSPEPAPLRSPTSLVGCPDRHGEDDDDAEAGLRAGVAGAAQLRGRGPVRPRQVPRPRRRPPRLHHTEGAAHLFSLLPPVPERICPQHNLKLNCISSLFSFKFLFGRLFSV